MTVERYFQQRADSFDALYESRNAFERWVNLTFRRGLYDRVRLTLAELEGMRDFSVLDVGCGSGRLEPLLVQAGATRVVGVDFSGRMLELARQHCHAAGVEHACEFVQADFLRADFPRRFDVAVALGVFDYFADPLPPLRRMAQLAQRKVIASFPGRSLFRAPFRKFRYALRNCPVYFYSRRQLEQVAADAGLRATILPFSSSGFMLVGGPKA